MCREMSMRQYDGCTAVSADAESLPIDADQRATSGRNTVTIIIIKKITQNVLWRQNREYCTVACLCQCFQIALHSFRSLHSLREYSTSRPSTAVVSVCVPALLNATSNYRRSQSAASTARDVTQLGDRPRPFQLL